MDWHELEPGIHACIRPAEGANLGLIATGEGWVLMDTAFCALELLSALDARGVVLADLRLTFNSHFHADHTWGNQLVHSPILGHWRCRDLMLRCAEDEWSPAARERWLAEIATTHPDEAARCRERLTDLRVTAPDDVFRRARRLTLGKRRLEFLHCGGHSPDLSVMWLPDDGVLFAADLLFRGRYPYLGDADVPAWTRALARLARLTPARVVPGHGGLAAAADLDRQRVYLEETWQRCAEHRARGRSLEAMLADPRFPGLEDVPDPGGQHRLAGIRAIAALEAAATTAPRHAATA
ncbi:MAG: MBL fold metallo-hydrolase [Candidatus Krumholzibacteriia bacterium]